MTKEAKCDICGGKASKTLNGIEVSHFFECEACGRFKIGTYENKDKPNRNFLASFLYYSKISPPIADKRYFCFFGSKEKFEEIQKECPYARFVTNQEAENWYPKTFDEKINRILLGFSKLSKYDSSSIEMTYEQCCSAFFVKICNSDDSEITKEERDKQIKLIENHLLESNFIKENKDSFGKISITLLPAGLRRIDELKKNQS